MVRRWDVITIGNLSRNRYWGEREEMPVRPALCTCTLVTGEGFRVLVDPSVEDAKQMAAELDRRSGLKPADVDVVFITHEHGDHHYGLKHFPAARWLAAPAAAAAINASRRYERPVEPAPERIVEGVAVIPTPGHTHSHHSLRFECDGLTVVVAGDAVMTRDFWSERRGYLNSVDPDQARRTIEELAAVAEIIVPGHDNYFVARR